VQNYYDGNDLLAVVFRDGDWQEGLQFISADDDFLQVGFWQYNEGKVLKAHRHKVFERTAERTQESIYVRCGKVRVDLYSEQKQPCGHFELREGDVATFLMGGHGYKILQNNTRIIEFKNGPFLGVDKDKELIGDGP
jgi:hypothetical protein